MAFGGEGISRHEGKVIFVADALPGEEVLVEIVSEKERYAKGQVVERLTAAPYALPNPCPYAARCGACQWLEVPYSLQLEWKRSFIASALERIAALPESAQGIRLTPSPTLQGYRNRIKIKLRLHSDGRLELGYFARGTHELVPIAACWVAEDPINRSLEALLHSSGHPELKALGRNATYELELQSLPEGVTASFMTRETGAVPREVRRALRRATESTAGLAWDEGEDAESKPRFFDAQNGLRYHTYPGQFQQVNLKANHLLRDRVRTLVQELAPKKVLDLYCGSGNFSLQLAAAGIEVWGLELAPRAIDCAQKNLELNQMTGALYLAAPVEQLRSSFPELTPGSIDLVIADPPRAGMPEALGLIEELSPRHLIYISCDPTTLARDLKRLGSSGYRINSVEGFDFFPHSFHIETLVNLEKAGF